MVLTKIYSLDGDGEMDWQYLSMNTNNTHQLGS